MQFKDILWIINNARLIVPACRAAMTINPDNPMAVAKAFPELWEAAQIVDEFFIANHDFDDGYGSAKLYCIQKLRQAMSRMSDKRESADTIALPDKGADNYSVECPF